MIDFNNPMNKSICVSSPVVRKTMSMYKVIALYRLVSVSRTVRLAKVFHFVTEWNEKVKANKQSFPQPQSGAIT